MLNTLYDICLLLALKILGYIDHLSLLLCHHDDVSIINWHNFCRVILAEHFIRHMFIASS